MRRIAYLSNIFVRIEDFFVACFGLWIDSFCFLAVRPMEATKNSTPSSLSSLYSLRYLTLYPDNMKYGPAFNCPSGSLFCDITQYIMQHITTVSVCDNNLHDRHLWKYDGGNKANKR